MNSISFQDWISSFHHIIVNMIDIIQDPRVLQYEDLKCKYENIQLQMKSNTIETKTIYETSFKTSNELDTYNKKCKEDIETNVQEERKQDMEYQVQEEYKEDIETNVQEECKETPICRFNLLFGKKKGQVCGKRILTDHTFCKIHSRPISLTCKYVLIHGKRKGEFCNMKVYKHHKYTCQNHKQHEQSFSYMNEMNILLSPHESSPTRNINDSLEKQHLNLSMRDDLKFVYDNIDTHIDPNSFINMTSFQ